MKRTSLVLTFLFAAATAVVAQTQIRERRLTDRVIQPPSEESAVRNRVVGGEKSSNHASKENNSPTPATGTAKQQDGPKPAWGDTAVPMQTQSGMKLLPPVRAANTVPNSQTKNPTQPKLIKQTALAVDNTPSPANLRPSPVNMTAAATSVYRVGIGDVLDIRLANMSTRESTLFTVMKDGAVEYPLLPRPLIVLGLTTDEIARRLNTEIKVIQNARALVGVRDYASHAAVVTGLVDNPGRKILRREAIPLYAILSEALPRSEATTAVILRNGNEMNVSLSNNQELSMPVFSGDMIKIIAAPKQFVYLGGDVASAGEKEYREGMTLTQALMAAGGVPRDARNKVKIARRNATGYLASEEHSLQAIDEGKAPDPLLQAGDRIEVRRGVW